MSRSDYQLRVGRKLGEFGRIRELLLPHEARTIGQEPQGETRVTHEELVGRTPRQAVDRLVIVVRTKGMRQRPLFHYLRQQRPPQHNLEPLPQALERLR